VKYRIELPFFFLISIILLIRS